MNAVRLSIFLLVSSVGNVYAADTSYAEARGMSRVIMDKTYGSENYIKKYDCWRFTEKESELSYCMSINQVNNISQKNGDYVYILASNEFESEVEDVYYSYSRGDRGVVAAFVLHKINNDWSVLASNTAFISEGGFAATGANGATFTQLGDDYWGWVFSNGMQTMGSVNYFYTILAKVGSDIQDISDRVLPETCDAGLEYGGGVLYNYKISVNKSTKTKIYPVALKEYKQDKFIKSYTSVFDAKKQRYVASPTFCNRNM